MSTLQLISGKYVIHNKLTLIFPQGAEFPGEVLKLHPKNFLQLFL